MPQNLRNKIMLILNDGETLNRAEIGSKLERLFIEELQFLETEHTINKHDLTEIRSAAIGEFNKMLPSDYGLEGYGVGDDMRAWAYVNAVVSFLRRKGLISFKFAFHSKKQ